MAFVSESSLADWSTGTVPNASARCAWTATGQPGWWPDAVGVTEGITDVHVDFRGMRDWFGTNALWASKVRFCLCLLFYMHQV